MTIGAPNIRFWRLALGAAVAAALLGMSASPASAQIRKSFVERYDSWESFEARRFGFLSSDIRPVDIETCFDDGRAWWVAVYAHQPNFQAPNGFDEIVRAEYVSSFLSNLQALAGQAWLVDDLDIASASTPGYARQIAVLNPSVGEQDIFVEATFSAFNINRVARNAAGLRLVDLDVATIDGLRRYYGVMRTGAHEEQLIRESTWADFTARRSLLSGQGWRLRDIAAAEGEVIGLFDRGNGPHVAEAFGDWAALLSRAGQLDNNGRGRVRLVDVECWSEGGSTRYAGVWRGDRRARPEANPNVGPVQQPSSPTRPTAPPVNSSGG